MSGLSFVKLLDLEAVLVLAVHRHVLINRVPMGGEKKGKTYGCLTDQPATSAFSALNEQVCALMGQKKGTYWKPYKVPDTGTTNLNYAKGIKGIPNEYGGFTPTKAWANVRKTKSKKQFPQRNNKDNTIKDNRAIVTGWVNGHFYGYPKYREIYGNNGEKYFNPFEGGVRGSDPKTGDIIYGKKFTEEDPLIYYNKNGKELYKTWYGKPLDMDEETALELCAEFYSCGDNGLDQYKMNWPFGTYFGYGQSLGGIGKSASQSLSSYPYNCTTVQFTNTATAYGSKVQPAYDTEILYMPPIKSKVQLLLVHVQRL